jgi:hypothetical protein
VEGPTSDADRTVKAARLVEAIQDIVVAEGPGAWESEVVVFRNGKHYVIHNVDYEGLGTTGRPVFVLATREEAR